MQAMTTMNSYNDKEEFRFKLDRLKESVDPRYLVESLGFSITRETAKEVRGMCKIHGGDNKTSFRFNKENKTWVCFSHRCHEVFGNDIIGLIKGALNVDFIAALKYLESLVGEVGSVSYIEHKRKKERNSFIKSRKETKAKSYIVTEEHLKTFKGFRSDYFINKGFSKEVLDFFEIAGGYTDGHGYIRDIIPIRDDMGKLMAYSMRDIREDADDDYKYIFTTGFDKDMVIYNLYNAKQYIKDKPLILVEGQKSVWRLYEYGIKNVAAIMGTFLVPGQVSLLYRYILNGIVVMFDNDGPGYSGCIKICEELRNKMDVMPVFITETDENGKGLDPSDLSRELIYNYLRKFI